MCTWLHSVHISTNVTQWEVMTNNINNKCQIQIQHIITMKLRASEASFLPRTESLTWGYHSLVHIFTACLDLLEVSPPHPLKHTQDEAMQVVTMLKFLALMRRILLAPWGALIVKMYEGQGPPPSLLYTMSLVAIGKWWWSGAHKGRHLLCEWLQNRSWIWRDSSCLFGRGSPCH